jgi:hypothetical protein
VSTFDPFGTGLPANNDLPTDEMEVVADALVVGTSELKVKIPDVPDVEDLAETAALKPYRKNRPAPPLEQYVAQQVGEVKVLVATGRLTNEIHRGEDRIARAERYARWRWQGYKDGEIKSL